MNNQKFILSFIFFLSIQITGIQFQQYQSHFTNDIETLIEFLSHNKESRAFLLSMLINITIILTSFVYYLYIQFFTASSKDIRYLKDSFQQQNLILDLIILNIWDLKLIDTQLDYFLFIQQIVFCCCFKSLLELSIHNFKTYVLNNSNDILQEFKDNRSKYIPQYYIRQMKILFTIVLLIVNVYSFMNIYYFK